MKYTKILVMTIIALAGVFAVTAHYGTTNYGNEMMNGYNHDNYRNNNYESMHESMEEIVEKGTYADLETYRTENNGFGGPRFVTNEETFQTWKEMHEIMEQEGYEPGYMRGNQRGHGNSGARGGCQMSEIY